MVWTRSAITDPVKNILSPPPIYLSLMRRNLEDAIKSFEPRINSVRVNFEENYETNDLYVKIYFSVASFPLNLEEMNVVLERVR